jgi:dienelactone hydrolase
VRYELDPHQQAQDVHDAVTFLLQQPGVDDGRVGVFGYSYSAAHAMRAGALDRRIKAVVSLSSLLSGDWVLGIGGGDRAVVDRIVWDDRAARVAGHELRYFPVVPTDEDGKENAILPTADAIEFYTRMRRTKSPEWENKVTAQSQAMVRSYDVHAFLPLLAPTPLLMIVDEESLQFGLYQTAFEIAQEPKEWGTFPGGHFDGLQGRAFEIVVETSVDFLKRWLGG